MRLQAFLDGATLCAVLAAVCAATACGGRPGVTDASGGAAGSSGSGAGASGESGMSGEGGAGGAASGAGGVGGSAGSASGSGGIGGDDRTSLGVCARWNADRANLTEGTWSGSVAACDPGDISADGRDNALRQYNLFRWLADMPAVTTDPARDQEAQACALMQQANGMLSHMPPATWLCYTALGAMGSAQSNISSGPGVQSALAYMIDNGNADTLGHRRWVLANSLGPIGLGSTGTGASCMQNLNGTGRAGKAWTAWPPPGAFPIQAVATRRTSIDTIGWSIQSDTINLANAVVSVTVADVAQPVTQAQLPGGYGSRYALSFTPMGWVSTPGTIYSVSVSGVTPAIQYFVTIIDCEP